MSDRSKSRSKYKLTGVGIEPTLKAEVKELAKNLDIPFNQVVEDALKFYLNNRHRY